MANWVSSKFSLKIGLSLQVSWFTEEGRVLKREKRRRLERARQTLLSARSLSHSLFSLQRETTLAHSTSSATKELQYCTLGDKAEGRKSINFRKQFESKHLKEQGSLLQKVCLYIVVIFKNMLSISYILLILNISHVIKQPPANCLKKCRQPCGTLQMFPP